MDWRLWLSKDRKTLAPRGNSEFRVKPPAAAIAPLATAGSVADRPAINGTTYPHAGTRPRSSAIGSPITKWLQELHAKYKGSFDGQLASYIPELTRANPAHFAISLATADGERYQAGDSEALFTIQSISKPFVYGLALEDHGADEVLRRVGVEPTGEAFNSIVMDEANNRPFNPMVNAGAIATTSLVKGATYEERRARIAGMFSRYAGRPLTIDQDVFKSERATGHRNRAIAFLQLNSGMIQEPVLEHLDLYFEQCSILITARDLAMMAATLANNGVNPLTGERAIAAEHVKSVLTVMASCGMYDYSGEWVYRVGLPAKSGVGGGIIAVLPGQCGFGVFSPLLDVHGNSHRGIEVCKELSQRFSLHVYDTPFVADRIVRRSYRCGTVTSKRQRGGRERRVLDRNGSCIAVYELQGDLYFATAEQLIRRILADLDQVSFLILDGRRVPRLDASALRLLRDFSQSLAANDKRLVLAGFKDDIASRWLEAQEKPDANDCQSDVDIAIEFCENELIAKEGVASLDANASLPLAEMDILRKMTPDQITRIEPYLQFASHAAGDMIIREGDSADRLFMLASGSAFVSVSLDDGKRSSRMAAFRPGVVFGEFALFDRGKRVANVIAETDVTCYVLTFDQLDLLEKHEPDIYHRIIFALGRFLCNRLRRVTAEVRALS